jgi:hypothetical protein
VNFGTVAKNLKFEIANSVVKIEFLEKNSSNLDTFSR